MCVSMYVCMLSTFSNIFSSETTGPIEAKFHMESSWDGGTKVCSNGPGHMTKGRSDYPRTPQDTPGHPKTPLCLYLYYIFT